MGCSVACSGRTRGAGQTDTHTHTHTQTKYHNPPVHAPRVNYGLYIVKLKVCMYIDAHFTYLVSGVESISKHEPYDAQHPLHSVNEPCALFNTSHSGD